jgi:tetratricopeptide (TPR) repeat protein
MFSIDHNTIDLDTRKALGKAHLNSNRIEDAIQVYARIIRDYPEDIDAYNFLGDCYLANGDANAALLLYSQALEQQPDNPEVHRRLRQARNECVDHWNLPAVFNERGLLPEGCVPTNPEAVANLLQELTNHTTPISEYEVVKAARLLDEIVHSSQPAITVAEHLDEINGLMPALLELNIRQAHADGNADLVTGLRNLLENIQIQKYQGRVLSISQKEVKSSDFRILILDYPKDINFPQAVNLGEIFTELGCQVTLWDGQPANDINEYTVIIARNPHIRANAMELLAGAHTAKVPIGLYLEADLEQMPVSHPDYELVGIRTPGLAKAYTAALLLADRIITQSEVFAECLRASNDKVCVIPHCWNNKSGLWLKPAIPHHTINLGWVGAAGEVEDVFTIRRMIVRVLREFPLVRLVIGGDAAVYQLFDNLPESRRLYLPLVSIDDYPYILSQIDILLLPFRNTSFNQMLSERRVIDAGIKAVPWIASPIPAYQKWNKGGLFANTLDEWHTYLRQLVIDSELRDVLGNAGQTQAQYRTKDIIQKYWFKLIVDMLGSDE